jgi:hypothetical protein
MMPGCSPPVFLLVRTIGIPVAADEFGKETIR